MSRLNVDKITGATGTSSGAPITLSGDTAPFGSGATLGSGVTIGDAVSTTSDTRRLVRVTRETNTTSVTSNTSAAWVSLFSSSFTATSDRIVVVFVNTAISVRAGATVWAKIENGTNQIALNSYYDNAVNGHVNFAYGDFMVSGSDVGSGSSKTYTVSVASTSSPAVTLGGYNQIVFMEFI